MVTTCVVVATEFVAVHIYITKSSYSVRSMIRLIAGTSPTWLNACIRDENGLPTKRFHFNFGVGLPAVTLHLMNTRSFLFTN
jgi:hypothetical protein